MLDSKFIFTLIGLIVAVMAICKTNFDPSISESFINVPRTRKVERIQQTKQGNVSAVQNNTQAMLGSAKFVSFPSFQSNIAPRFSSTGYGAYINYDPPSYEHQGVPCNSLGYGDMVKENYDVKEDYSCGSCANGCSSGNCQTSGNATGLPGSGTAAPKEVDYINAANKMYEGGEEAVSTLPVGSMETVGVNGNEDQVLNLDRYMYANQKSFTASQGCPFRGDLAIAPCNTGWFNTPYTPNVDLKQGAINVMAGNFNETSNALFALQHADSGGTQDISSGVYLGNEIRETLGAGQTDITVTAYP